MNIELYIDKQLCDLEDAKKFSIAFKRQFLNPAELNTKDAQKSYEITLPATTRNNFIFGFRNVEEVQGKFTRIYDAHLIVGGVKIFDSKFRLSEISRGYYKGNLGVPAPVSVKDVFGDTTLNNAGDWIIDDFYGFDTVSEYNAKERPECLFPLVLYGLLPKYPQNNQDYTAKDLFDSSVILGLDDFLPSVNCIEMLKKIFNNAGYTLSGSALLDERLNNLYMSYKNPSEYEFDWGASSMKLRGSWRHCKETGETSYSFENKYKLNTERKQYAINIFDAGHSKNEVESDSGGNISIKNNRTTIIIPRTGLYKVHLRGTLIMLSDNVPMFYLRGIGVKEGNLNDAPIEVHLVKNLDKDLDEINFNNKFSLDNIDQEINSETAIFPQKHRVNFIDPKQDKNFLCGFAFGRHGDENYRNPLNEDYCNPMAISGGRSWDFENGNGVTDRTFSATYSPGYRDRNGKNISNDNFTVDLQNANTETWRHEDWQAGGDVMQVVWLEKGDRLDLLTTTAYHFSGLGSGNVIYGYNIVYTLEIEPFNHYIDWLKMDVTGSSSAPMNWNDPSTFIENQINIMKSLPSEMKVNDWIDNFCKAFNLILYNTGGTSFNLDVKDKETTRFSSLIIDLDNKVNVNSSTNQPLNIPYMYELGFTVDTSEEGYYRSQKRDEHDQPIINSGNNGGGIFYTNSQNSNKISQTSSFSYCWYKEIKYKDGSIIRVPVITDHEIWLNDYDYAEMLSKQFFDMGLRFWYKSGVKEISIDSERTITNALLSNEYTGNRKLTLDYTEKPSSIASTFFRVFSNETNYTVVECYLTPEEYSNINNSLIRFNGDLYYIAEIDGYDPLGRRKATIKMIRKVL